MSGHKPRVGSAPLHIEWLTVSCNVSAQLPEVRVSVEDEMSTPTYMQAGVPQVSLLSPTLYSLYINDTPKIYCVHLTLFADDTCLHTREKSSVGKIQWWPGVNVGILKIMKTRLRRSTFLINKDCLILSLSANIKLTLHKALIRSVMTYACPAWEFAAGIHLLKLQCLQNRVSTPLAISQDTHRSTICRWLSKFHMFMITWQIIQEASRSHPKSWKWKCSLHWTSRSPVQKI
jgi:hypothetical protein